MDIDIPLPDDLTTLTVEQAINAMAAIEVAQRDLAVALDALRVVATTQTRIAETAGQWLDVRDGHAPDPATATVDDYPAYVAPTGAHDAYPQGRIIRADGQLWQARRSGVAHSPAEAPEEWQRVWIIDGALSVTPPPDPDTGQPDWPDWDASTAYRRGDETIMVVHAGRLWELIHTNADAGWEPGAAGMHAVWADRGPVGGGGDA